MPRCHAVYNSVIYVYNMFHPKFHISFVDAEEQVKLANLIRTRMKLRNCLDDHSTTFDVDLDEHPCEKSPLWNNIKLEDLESQREALKIPILTEGLLSAIYNAGIGNYRHKREVSYSILEVLFHLV